jgi:hypothetical protein
MASKGIFLVIVLLAKIASIKEPEKIVIENSRRPSLFYQPDCSISSLLTYVTLISGFWRSLLLSLVSKWWCCVSLE